MKSKIFAVILLVGVLGAGISQYQRNFIDYVVFEEAGQRILDGQGTDLFSSFKSTPFYYSYFFAWIFAGFVALGAFGKALFGFLFYASYVYLLYASIDETKKLLGKNFPREDVWTLLTLTILGSLYAINDAFMNSNPGLLLLALCLLSYRLAEKNPWTSGIVLGVAINFKIYPVILLCHFIWEHRWKVVQSSLITTLSLYILFPMALEGISGGWGVFLAQFQQVSQYDNVPGWRYDNLVFQNLSGTGIRLLANFGVTLETAFRASLLFGMLTMIGFYLPGFLRKNRTDNQKRRFFFLSLAAVPILVPVSWYNMALFYVPILCYLIARGLNEKSPIILSGIGLYFFFFCLTAPDIVSRPINDILEMLGIPFLGVMALVAAFSFLIFREERKLFSKPF